MLCSNYPLIYNDMYCRINKQLLANLKPAPPIESKDEKYLFFVIISFSKERT